MSYIQMNQIRKGRYYKKRFTSVFIEVNLFCCYEWLGFLLDEEIFYRLMDGKPCDDRIR
jgi:hypothetical protein